ncbi:hypothetical protein D9756_005896 [Leucocoprinus leucothites]|uniref:BRCA2 OB1 domain-containing protein n=1 Tax=Leucocoprinus leucothites TaxID=201217 RepID=A0A8H5D4X6_9AGAR|nr:hypothetical protein D9756_005896 [Leucoagaricus leucothites]
MINAPRVPHMRPYEQTPPSSPVKKKPRLSSPENAAQSSSQEQLDAALDNSFVLPNLGFSKANALLSAGISNSSGVNDDPDNPFTNQLPKVTKASSVLSGLGFASASSIKFDATQSAERSPPSEFSKEQDYEAWFKPATSISSLGFQTATFASASSVAPSSAGFVSIRSQTTLAPSATALAKAQARLEEIWNEDSTGSENIDPSTQIKDQFATPASISAQPTFNRPALQTLDNGAQTPSTPTPAGFSRPSIPSKPQAVDQLRARQKPFKSPLLKNTSGLSFVGSPLNPGVGTANAASVSSQRPMPTIPSTPFKSILSPAKLSSFQTPVRAPMNIPRTTPAPFVTPFKSGMRPGEPGWAKLQDSMKKGGSHSIIRSHTVLPHTYPNSSKQKITNHIKSFFDLRPPPNRKTLADSGMRPQQFDQEDFELMDINIRELQQVTPTLAAYYSFHTASTLPPSQKDQTVQILGPEAALKQLHDLGCTLATKAWVDNHWGLVLWKLAGMVALDPDSESDPRTKRWCWTEVKRQLLYRYERELNRAKRPALRLIVTQDAPAALPLTLCVSGISWVETEGGRGVTYPELEVTDGWYRLRAKIDAPMVRAVKRGIIRVGRKIGVAGAKLDSERKEPQEILDAYNSVNLVLSGNSSHLLSWDAKLGFVRGPCISTMHSLTPDGGSIAAMDVVVVKTHAVAFIEFFVDASGRKRREGPRGEAEEMKINEEWKKKRDREASKFRAEFEKKVARYESYIDKLERRAGNHFRPHHDDEPPDHIEKLYDQLEEHDDAIGLLSRIGAQDAGWLAGYTRRCLASECERAGEEIARELEAACPPRDIRSFRVLVVEDSRTCRRPANRHAQLTVWDVLGLTLFEGAKPGAIEVGSRFLITNLIIQQQGAWMGNGPGSQIFLSTTRASRWRKLKASD